MNAEETEEEEVINPLTVTGEDASSALLSALSSYSSAANTPTVTRCHIVGVGRREGTTGALGLGAMLPYWTIVVYSGAIQRSV